jgi:hypothetical protein
MQLAITNVITVSVSLSSPGLTEYNTSNVGLFTSEQPGMTFGSLGYNNYLAPTQVGVDFGTGSTTYAMANSIFSQNPNILAGSGQLVVIPMIVAVQNLALSGIAASGTFVLNYGGHATAAINWNDSASVIQTKLQAVAGLAEVAVSGSIVSESLNVTFYGTYGAQALLTVTSNSLMTSAPAAITFIITTATPGETIGAAITRTQGLVPYFAVITNSTLAQIGQTDLLAAAAIIQPLNVIGLFVSYNSADINPGGMIDVLRTGGFTQTRGLYYGDASVVQSVTGFNAIQFMAAYVGRAFSVNFEGSNTTITMHLKSLSGPQSDPTMTQSFLNLAIAAGADSYPSIAGDPAVFCSGKNLFFDQIYNLQWFTGAIQVAGFNFLAQSNSKIPQTEAGMDGLKGAYRNVCEQAVTNQYLAPGTWNSPNTFGVLADFYANISQRGYYIYSAPISQQSQTARVARQAPLIQLAGKEAGAIQSSAVMVSINP